MPSAVPGQPEIIQGEAFCRCGFGHGSLTARMSCGLVGCCWGLDRFSAACRWSCQLPLLGFCANSGHCRAACYLQVLQECHAAVGIYQGELLQEVAYILRTVRSSGPAAARTRQVAMDVLRHFGSAGGDAYRLARQQAPGPPVGARLDSVNRDPGGRVGGSGTGSGGQQSAWWVWEGGSRGGGLGVCVPTTGAVEQVHTTS